MQNVIIKFLAVSCKKSYRIGLKMLFELNVNVVGEVTENINDAERFNLYIISKILFGLR